jgi:hypothetical protein
MLPVTMRLKTRHCLHSIANESDSRLSHRCAGRTIVAERNHAAERRSENMHMRDKFLPKTQLPILQDQEPHFLDRITSAARVLIIEGISGSGKDTLQTYLKTQLEGRDVYDYSEGEVLYSWKQLLIQGIFDLRIKFMKHFVNYVRDTVARDKNAVFLLNRFHLTAYVLTIIREPKLQGEYDEIINILSTLPVHVFILQLDENEIENRCLHPERPGVWRKFIQEIAAADKGGFPGRLERQQRLILETAEKQQIPYSVIRLPTAPYIGDGRIRIPESRNMVDPGARINSTNSKVSRKKRRVPETV